MGKSPQSDYIGTSLKRWRTESNKLTQLQLAEYLGVSNVTLSRWEANQLKCAHPKLLALALAHYDCPQ